MKNSTNNLGSKIKNLREKNGLTQQELADKLKVTRPTFLAIENNKRELKISEAQRLASFFSLSLSELLDQNKVTVKVATKTSKAKKTNQKQTHRINIPQKNFAKFKEALLYLLDKVGAKPNVGETVLYKLLYFIDFDFYEKYEEQFMGCTYIKNKFGPTPIEFPKVLEKMIANQEIEKVKSQYFKMSQRKYLPLRQADLSVLSARELEVINSVIRKLSDKNATSISEYSHKDVPWVITKEKEPIDYEAVFYRTPDYSVRKYHQDEEADL